MPLMDHLRELRSRLLRGLLAIAVGVVVAWIGYPWILDWLTDPFNRVAPELEAQGIDARLIMSGIGGAFQFQLKTSLIVGLVISSPGWMWQIWAFVLPAMHRNEKRWAALLTALGAPLFIGGAAAGYYVLPTAVELLIGFVPEGWENLTSGADYLSFILRIMLVFGVAAQIPLVVVLLNRIGVVSARQLARARPWTILGIFIFSAVATPTVDPLTMLFLAVPMTALYLVSELIARLTDRRRANTRDELADTQPSSIEDPSPLDP
ncbi:twin-arginine translocase subunit TatC [Aeromicrobium phragmitis]|uniref:Sec-independent protein translocase protein TatC n=2 Tax=Aeromicrobium phragmitis TaxID=2478914 RepID=A0A3L8PJS1_9ACTN|nr:twin-arginine translocase subunit TatC [Aeromicrobium phragmitis]